MCWARPCVRAVLHAPSQYRTQCSHGAHSLYGSADIAYKPCLNFVAYSCTANRIATSCAAYVSTVHGVCSFSQYYAAQLRCA